MRQWHTQVGLLLTDTSNVKILLIYTTNFPNQNTATRKKASFKIQRARTARAVLWSNLETGYLFRYSHAPNARRTIPPRWPRYIPPSGTSTSLSASQTGSIKSLCPTCCDTDTFSQNSNFPRQIVNPGGSDAFTKPANGKSRSWTSFHFLRVPVTETVLCCFSKQTRGDAVDKNE